MCNRVCDVFDVFDMFDVFDVFDAFDVFDVFDAFAVSDVWHRPIPNSKRSAKPSTKNSPGS